MGTLLTQYGLYVESAEKVSHRRGIANNFFLLVNSAASVALAAFGLSSDEAVVWPLLFSTIIMISVCVLWGFTVHSYRQLSSAKWRIVNALEERLPAAPWAAEWQLLGRGKSRRGYRRLTAVEKWVPGLFALVYAVGFLALAFLG
ncbi:RipA family octameric membrane protein [Candidatus Poriferisodalis sp.]|uniref:RipA family octameric membrane protein n=1 Tax=Candidatus Poriferisodalis sp. TaxID=3101277 RepID=UPI003AF5987D